MHKLVLPTIAALALIAVAAQSRATSSAPEVIAPTHGVGWHLTHEGETAKLAYGLANSDQVALMMTCEPGGRYATVYGEVQPIAARSAPDAEAPMDPMTGGLADEAQVPLADRSIRAFAQTGRLVVEGLDGEAQLGSTSRERVLISGFFSHCADAHV